MSLTPVRMKDIAKALNVSVVTVSRAIRGRPDISDATRDAVLAKMRELRYQPNSLARSLVTGKTSLVGLVVPDLMQTFFAEIAHGITRTLGAAGYQVVIANSEEDPRLEEREIEALLARQVDGLIIASAQTGPAPPVLTELQGRGMPFVFLDRKVRGLSAHFVGVSDERIGRMATRHLIDSGRCRIAHIRGPQLTTAEGRLAGYRATLAEAGIRVPPSYVDSAAVDDESGYAAMTRLLACDPRPDAVFCYNDPVAVGAIHAILDAGCRVPDDIAVIGVANMHYSRMLRVPLSSIDQSSMELGRKSADLLLRLLRGKSERHRSVLLAPKLVVRASTSVRAAHLDPLPAGDAVRPNGHRRSD